MIDKKGDKILNLLIILKLSNSIGFKLILIKKDNQVIEISNFLIFKLFINMKIFLIY